MEKQTRVTEDLKGTVSHVVLNKLTGINIGYHLEEQAKEEVLIDKIIFGENNIELVEIEDIENPLIIDERDYQGGDLKVDNRAMISSNGQSYVKPQTT
tara:strand:- start:393 stop:686 length:294 start_codon:yes stop_codon:yes gene_type:complete